MLQTYAWIIKNPDEFKGEEQAFYWYVRGLPAATSQDLHDIVK